jgi:hypothetical protein
VKGLGLKEEFLDLLERDRSFRYAIAGLIGIEEVLRRLDKHEEELVRLREDMVAGFRRHDEILEKHAQEIAKLREDMVAGFRRHDEEIAKLREDMVAGFRRHDEEIAKLREDMNKGFMLVERHVSALGARWGVVAEEAFREGLKGLLEKEMKLKVEKWVRRDEEGRVFGYPSTVEVDAALHDGDVILVEVKSHVGASDVSLFKRKVDFYEKETGKKVARKIMVTPYAEEKAIEAAKSLGVEIYTKV